VRPLDEEIEAPLVGFAVWALDGHPLVGFEHGLHLLFESEQAPRLPVIFATGSSSPPTPTILWGARTCR